MPYLPVYAATLVSFAVLDFVWLGLIATSFYKAQIGTHMADQPNWAAALAFYALYIVGLMIFAIRPASLSGGVTQGMLLGALFGLFCYATYDLSNLATLKNWSLSLSLVDIGWGMVASGLAAGVGTYVASRY